MADAAAQRFPPPQFTETGHHMPSLTGPAPRAAAMDCVDVAVLLGALTLAAWLVLRRRSRRGVALLGLFSLLYFGFFRRGCVCAIGSIQDLALGFFDSTYAVPLAVLAFAVLPLLFALFFGRVFCAAVCPHGAFQDLMLLRPVRLPAWLEQGLRMLAYTYLGLALVFAATGGGFIICQYDPFVAIFRLGGSAGMVAAGAAFLIAAIFIGRPYCRFCCPYGVLLGLAQGLSWRRARITPDRCTLCRCCEPACPFDAIRTATPKATPEPGLADHRRLALLIALLPALAALGLWLGGLSGASFARRNAVVNLAERVHLEATGAVKGTTDASDAFRATGTSEDELYVAARKLRDRYRLAGRLCGAWVGLIAGLKLIALARRRRRGEYETDAVRCVACARCFEHCPQEQKRLKAPAGAPAGEPA